MTRRAFAIFIVAVVVVGVALAQVPGIFATLTADSLSCNTAGCALTNVPTAPTAVSGTNTTQIATTAFVNSAVAGTGITQSAQLGTASCAVNTNYTPCPNTIPVSPAMPNATYTAVCWGVGITSASGNAGLYMYEVPSSQTTTSFQVDVASNTTGTTQQYGNIVCILHD